VHNPSSTYYYVIRIREHRKDIVEWEEKIAREDTSINELKKNVNDRVEPSLKSLGKDTNYTNVIQALEKVAEYDSDGQVRRTALESIRKVKEEVKKQPPMRMITIQDLSKLDLSLRSQETRAMQKRIPTK
jgi:HEAT repeat protein